MTVGATNGIQDALRTATQRLRAGDYPQASAILRQVIEAAADNFEAHWTMATLLVRTHRKSDAVRELRTCAELRDGDPAALTAVAEALTQLAEVDAAERVLRDAVRRHAGSMAMAVALARWLVLRGRPVDALAALDRAAANPGQPDSRDTELLAVKGHAQMALGRAADAAITFQRWLALDPASTDARLRLAAALADDLRCREAENEVRTCMAAGVRSPNALFVLGRALMGQRRLAEAEGCFREAVRRRPDYVTAQANLSELVWMRTGDAEAASAELDSALRDPAVASDALRITKARLLVAVRNPGGALAEIERGLARAPADGALLRAGANIALQVDGRLALGYAQRALRGSPDDWQALVAFGNASLAVGHAAAALPVAEALCRRDPDNGEAVALRADSLRMAGDGRYRELLDYTAFVRAYRMDAPPGWPDLRAYLADLAAELDAMHVARAHPVQNSLRGGSQVPLEPDRSEHRAIRAFPLAIDGAIRRYLQVLGPGTDPMRRRNTGHYRLNGMWSVRLRTSGFHTNHYHPKGWISSACYVRVPPAVARHRGEGWLKFGEPAFPTVPPLAPEYFVRPEPGLVALFPAYLWHGTVPFAGGADDTRLTVAFDVVPSTS